MPLEAFYDVLREHGTFIDTDRYGTAFCPHPDPVGADQPHRRGHWVMTEYGWTFTSDLKISWVMDHYGRWVGSRAANCAWAWVPGGEWGPAWVDFRIGEKVVAATVGVFRWQSSSETALTPKTFRTLTSLKFRKAMPPCRRRPRGEFQARRLDYVALTEWRQFNALRETEPVRSAGRGCTV